LTPLTVRTLVDSGALRQVISSRRHLIHILTFCYLVKKQILSFLLRLCYRRNLAECYGVAFNGEVLRVFALKWPPNATDATMPTFYMSEPVHVAAAPGALSVADVLLRMSCVPSALPQRPRIAAPQPTKRIGRSAALTKDAELAQALEDVRIKPWLQGITVEFGSKHYTLFDVLGVGLTSKVAVYSDGDELYVLKCLHDNTDARALEALVQEEVILQSLSNPDAEGFAHREDVIPSLGCDASNFSSSVGTICIVPRCIPLRPFQDDDGWESRVHDLVSAIFIAAANGYVHRDVRLANIMLGPCDPVTGEFVAEPRAYLLDWGFAVNAGVAVEYRGTGRFASQRVLNLLIRGETTFEVDYSDDAVSLVKTLCHFVQMGGNFKGLPPQDTVLSSAACNSALVFWNQIFGAHPLWGDAYEAALQCRPETPQTYAHLEIKICHAIRLSGYVSYSQPRANRAVNIGLTFDPASS